MGVAGASGDEAAATAARLDSPRGIVVDDAGDIFIADTGNHRIRQVTPDGVIHNIAGTGTAGFAGDGGPAAGALLKGPRGCSSTARATSISPTRATIGFAAWCRTRRRLPR
jgi:hypothetical protein